MNTEYQQAASSLRFAATYLMYHWDYENNFNGEVKAYKALKKILAALPDMDTFNTNITTALNNWEIIIEQIDDNYIENKSWPEIHSLCQQILKIIEEIKQETTGRQNDFPSGKEVL